MPSWIKAVERIQFAAGIQSNDHQNGREDTMDVNERYNLELYSFCGDPSWYFSDLFLCVGEQDIVNNDYPNDDHYAFEQCQRKMPLSEFWKMELYILPCWCATGVFCCCWAGIDKMRGKRKKKAAERNSLERLQRENEASKYRKNANDVNVERRLEMERVRKKNANVYVGGDNYQSKQAKDEDNYNDALEDGLAKCEQFERKIAKNNKEKIISKQPTLSYSAMSCVICLDVLLENEATKLFCGHRFHTHCIEEYNENNSNCPLCRKTIQY